ncbi:MAG: MFS transporter, partial [Actinomycetota bacterium]|nr:MFS transporter [Actinomycetota bacterium]
MRFTRRADGETGGVPRPPSGLGATFRSLRVRNYRLFAAGQVVSLSGTWAQRVAQDWLVLELSGDSGVALGLAVGLQFLPVLLLGLYGGVLADRYDKRRLLLAAQAAMGLLALALAVLDLTGAVQLWHVYALALGLGVASAVDTPVRQAFVSEMVDPDDLPNAVSLNSATFNSARIVGPALAGAGIAAAGTGWVFLANALTYLAVIAGLAAMRPAELRPGRRAARAPGQTREGLVYVRSRPELLVPIVLVGVTGMVGLNFQTTLALAAKEVFGRGAGSYALLTSALALGSLLGALAGARGTGAPRQRRLFVAALAFGLLEVAVGLAPSFAVMAVLLVPTGVAVLTLTTTANSTLQLRSDPQLRGRVLALYVLVFLGGTPLGAPLVGALAEAFGARAAIVLGGAGTALAAVLSALWLARRRRLGLQ